MCSCEYLKVLASEQRRTKTPTLQNLLFFQHDYKLLRNQHELHISRTITIVFVLQKNEERNEDVTIHSTNDPLLYTIKSFASVVRSIRTRISTTDSTYVYMFTKSMKILSHSRKHRIHRKHKLLKSISTSKIYVFYIALFFKWVINLIN